MLFDILFLKHIFSLILYIFPVIFILFILCAWLYLLFVVPDRIVSLLSGI
jgi:hypothetical protein